MGTVTFDFSGSTVLITGGSTGIGREVALAFGRAGANVMLASRKAETGQPVAEEVTQAGGVGEHRATDVSDPADVEGLVADTVARFGRLDVAVNNAGTLPPTGRLDEQTDDAVQRTLGVDLAGVFWALRYETRAMLRSGGGAIVNTSSVAGLIADPGMSPYVAAKHGVLGLTKAAALDFGQQGIRVNAVAPGLTRTPMIEGWLADPEMRETVLGYNALHRVSEASEIAGAVLFLASDAASFITGTVLPIDGGQTAH